MERNFFQDYRKGTDVVKTASATLTNTERRVHVDISANATITLCNPADCLGFVSITAEIADTKVLTIACPASAFKDWANIANTASGAETDRALFYSDGRTWYILDTGGFA